MSAAAEILGELEKRGVTVRADGSTLTLKPRRALDDALLARVREAKPAILEALRDQPTYAWPQEGGFAGFAGTPPGENPIICPQKTPIIEKTPRMEPAKPAKPPELAALATVTYAWPSIPVPKAPFELVKDEFKTGPVRLSPHETVTDTFKFAMSTFAQLRRKLQNPKAHVGWTVAQLLERLQAVGLTVGIDEEVLKAIPPANPAVQ
jgi:hypothetical protein